MAYIAAQKVAGAYYPVVCVCTDRNKEYRVGIPRWQDKKWFLADSEIVEIAENIKIEPVKVHIPWDSYKTMEMRVNTVVYNALRLLEHSRHAEDTSLVFSFVRACIEGPKFELEVNKETGEAKLVSPFVKEDISDDPTQRFVFEAYDEDEEERLRFCKFFAAADKVANKNDEDEEERAEFLRFLRHAIVDEQRRESGSNKAHGRNWDDEDDDDIDPNDIPF